MNNSLLQVSVLITAEAEDAMAERLQALTGVPPTIYVDFETGIVRAVVYLDPKKFPTARIKKLIAAEVAAVQDCGLDIGTGEITAAKVKKEDWAESWKRHFKAIEIGDELLIKPSWIKRKPKKGQHVVTLDPGLSFGTGNHATTSFCLEQLVVLRDAGRRQSLLDVGCGSGILAIAGSMLGYAPVQAFDFDAEAVRVAKINAAVNGVEVAVRPTRKDLTKLPAKGTTKFDVICANLLYDLLLTDGRKLVHRLKPGGRLVLAGILITQFPKVLEQFEKWGLDLEACRLEKEWQSGTFRFAK
jgi:ribosomal protein L11 methyltransferase